MGVLNNSCFPTYGENNSPTELADIKSAIPTASDFARVPPSLFLAMMMQESDGCVRVGSTAAAVTNPGLMQSNNGEGSCAGLAPCPREAIRLMLMEGAGKGRDYGLRQALDMYDSVQSPRKFYLAARAYNAGPHGVVAAHLEQGGATHCYASDIANRLLGWTDRANTTCSFDLRSKPAPSGAVELSSIAVGSIPPIAPTSQLVSGTSKSCHRWHLVQAGDTCDRIGAMYNTTFGRLREINPGLNAECTNLWLGYFYCTEVR